MFAMVSKSEGVLMELMRDIRVDLDARDWRGRGIEEVARCGHKLKLFLEMCLILIFSFFCRTLGFSLGETMVAELRQERAWRRSVAALEEQVWRQLVEEPPQPPQGEVLWQVIEEGEVSQEEDHGHGQVAEAEEVGQNHKCADSDSLFPDFVNKSGCSVEIGDFNPRSDRCKFGVVTFFSHPFAKVFEEKCKKELEEMRGRHADQLRQVRVRQEEEKEEMLTRHKEEREARKNKSAVKKQPGAPECPVCSIFVLIDFALSTIFCWLLLPKVCMDEMAPPTRIFHCFNGHHICEGCK